MEATPIQNPEVSMYKMKSLKVGKSKGWCLIQGSFKITGILFLFRPDECNIFLEEMRDSLSDKAEIFDELAIKSSKTDELPELIDISRNREICHNIYLVI